MSELLHALKLSPRSSPTTSQDPKELPWGAFPLRLPYSFLVGGVEVTIPNPIVMLPNDRKEFIPSREKRCR
jgi:hypothetical protein